MKAVLAILAVLFFARVFLGCGIGLVFGRPLVHVGWGAPYAHGRHFGGR